jgi:hypothetical protein
MVGVDKLTPKRIMFLDVSYSIVSRGERWLR